MRFTAEPIDKFPEKLCGTCDAKLDWQKRGTLVFTETGVFHLCQMCSALLSVGTKEPE